MKIADLIHKESDNSSSDSLQSKRESVYHGSSSKALAKAAASSTSTSTSTSRSKYEYPYVYEPVTHHYEHRDHYYHQQHEQHNWQQSQPHQERDDRYPYPVVSRLGILFDDHVSRLDDPNIAGPSRAHNNTLNTTTTTTTTTTATTATTATTSLAAASFPDPYLAGPSSLNFSPHHHQDHHSPHHSRQRHLSNDLHPEPRYNEPDDTRGYYSHGAAASFVPEDTATAHKGPATAKLQNLLHHGHPSVPGFESLSQYHDASRIQKREDIGYDPEKERRNIAINMNMKMEYKYTGSPNRAARRNNVNKSSEKKKAKAKAKEKQSMHPRHHAVVPSDTITKARDFSWGSFPCTKCEEVFDEKPALLTHQKTTHVDKKSYKCYICSSSFTRKRDLVRHVKSVHMKLRPFQCDECGIKFGAQSILTKHKRTVHRIAKEFKCPYCTRFFREEKTMQSHVEGYHFKHRDKKNKDNKKKQEEYEKHGT